jgi:mannose-6-phosphate isomerase-like protein (cupin superfamily)
MFLKSSDMYTKKVGPMQITEYPINTQFSGALIEIDGHHGKMKCLSQDRIYYVVSGEGEFTIKEEAQSVQAKDVLFVPMNTPYNFYGKRTMFLVCSPQFMAEDDVVIE